MAIRDAANRQLRIEHPLLPHIKQIDITQFSLSLSSNATSVHYRNVVVFGDEQLDRSPCGTGTCAKMAVLHRQGQLDVGQAFVHDSIIGSTFTGHVLDTTTVGAYPAIVPQITGTAWITGINHFVVEADDPYQEGLLLG